MNIYQLIAVVHHVNDWPQEICFQSLINRLNAENYGLDEDEIIIREYLGNTPGCFIAELIVDLEQTLIKHFLEKNHACI